MSAASENLEFCNMILEANFNPVKTSKKRTSSNLSEIWALTIVKKSYFYISTDLDKYLSNIQKKPDGPKSDGPELFWKKCQKVFKSSKKYQLILDYFQSQQQINQILQP